MHEPRQETTFTPPPREPVAAPLQAPVPFQAVSEHDQLEAQDEAHRPNRKRRQPDPKPVEQSSLQLVETSVPAPPPEELEDTAPRRTKPRRRRGGPAPSEPLQLVETQHEEPRQDNAPTA